MNKNKINESGRSMVEMLGVLAVIGVLSVAGIAGYSNAMKKYKANELLNEVSKRATVVAMQIASGRSPNISEFGNNTVQGVSITADEYTTGAKTFSFTLGGTSLSDICPKLSEAVGDNSFMTIGTGCATITFNADLSRGETNAEPEPPKTVDDDPTLCFNSTLFSWPDGITVDDVSSCFINASCAKIGQTGQCNFCNCLLSAPEEYISQCDCG